ncbi:nicotinate (nicotinamide) nucleotide adenylyltransferase [Treponema phagedenis]|uniref:nicotinate (nicotinamide) nucleotide adenylyltransferase n=1 Tax=Treponema phagedenis TaxID=162 RepID=UPI0001F64350|nr:nicotinate (nicotinamide) nucleotide adenylyltransferase [Treponema phagedenis]EFW38714.1 nicotinate-nucleotide adenylyltransferase [Treponema phagedenis F0421]TYT79656.1 nicotinate (nicotinamide) nucleotide adenylyltransferase [Treponema phagedenis]
MRLAILGGSFNPLHIGHLALADAVYATENYDKIAFIPAFLSPFKKEHSGCTAKDRLQMLKTAIQDVPYFSYEDCEIKKEGISYTIDTILYLKEKYKSSLEGKIGLIIGEDMIKDFPLWHRYKELKESVDILVGFRPLSEKKTAAEFSYTQIENTVLPISSSYIREAIKKKKSWRYLVPATVYEYIIAKNLYD